MITIDKAGSKENFFAQKDLYLLIDNLNDTLLEKMI